MRDVFVNGGDQFGHAGEHAVAQSVGRDVTEEPLDHVQPRGGGWREVHVDTRVLGQPLLHDRMLVRRIVVGDEVQRLVLGRLAVDLAQELQPFSVGVCRGWHWPMTWPLSTFSAANNVVVPLRL